MILSLSILLALSFIVYHFTFFSYCAYIFNTNRFPKIAGVVCGVINLSIWFIYLFFLPIELEPLAIFLCFIILVLETKVVFKATLIQMLFIAVTFTINLFAKRLAVLALGAIYYDDIITHVMGDLTLSLVASITCFTASVFTIGFARKSIPRNSLDTILSDNKNLAFLTTAYLILFVTLFAFLLTIGLEESHNFLFFYVILGLITISAFAVFIIFAYNLAELRIQTETYKRLSKKNTEDLKQIKSLEQVAIKDALTYLYTRDYADELVRKMIDDNHHFFVAFVDIDGLKIVNDEYGHEEGDFYIKTVAEILQDYFITESVCRYGGDEMVVIGTCNVEDEITKRLIQTYKAVANIPKLYSKPYSTSISYGVAFKHPYEVIEAAELISIADSRMYELKKSNKKHRKVISVQP